jgi:nitroimidazol reductase NimA-like FMN-containing flavoprotein (pyridoxamine 5'-phosphate oxidase superfamily)
MASYHLRRKDREIRDEAAMRDILKKGKYAVIAMARGNEPYLVTLSYGWDAEASSLWFHCAKEGQKLDFLKSNNRVCATVIEDLGYLEGQCEHSYRSLVLRGHLEAVTALADKKRGLCVLLSHLEADPAPILARNISDDASYDKVVMLRLRVEEMAGKESLGASS